MATFEHDAVIRALGARASDQVKAAIAALTAGRLLESQVFLNAAAATMQSLIVLLEKPEPVRPFRKLALVRSPSGEHVEDTLPGWFARKANDNGGDNGAA